MLKSKNNLHFSTFWAYLYFVNQNKYAVEYIPETFLEIFVFDEQCTLGMNLFV